MSLKPLPIGDIPQITQQVARAAFRKGNLYLRLRDELGTLYTDEDFAAFYSPHGRPTLPAWRLALVTVMQFMENLSDRQAANAVRGRIDWKYALGLELTDPGFDYSVLSEFRTRLVEGGADQLLLDRMLTHFQEKGLIQVRSKQRTDSTHVLASIRVMNRLELVAETLRAALNELAAAAPDWLRSFTPAEWYERYAQRIEESRLPKGEAPRKRFTEQVGHDGFFLLDTLAHSGAPSGLASLSAVETLRQVWERHYERTAEGKARWRAGPELGRAATAIESPYDIQARHSSKRDTVWTGYKVHLSETCADDFVRVITNVHTTVATTQDVSSTADIHQELKGKDLLPGMHLVDAGYIDAQLLVQSREQYGVTLFGPTRQNPSWQAREDGYDQTQFAVDWEKQQAICPEGKSSVYWRTTTARPYGYEVVKVCFSSLDCSCCARRDKCVRSRAGRQLLLRSQAHQEALAQARAFIDSAPGRQEYQRRAGVEGTLSQGIRRCGLRRCRYRGLDKTHLQHVATAAALNVARVIDHLSGHKPATTQVSRLSRLAA